MDPQTEAGIGRWMVYRFGQHRTRVELGRRRLLWYKDAAYSSVGCDPTIGNPSCPHRLVRPRTSALQAENGGSNPPGDTTSDRNSKRNKGFLTVRGFDPHENAPETYASPPQNAFCTHYNLSAILRPCAFGTTQRHREGGRPPSTLKPWRGRNRPGWRFLCGNRLPRPGCTRCDVSANRRQALGDPGRSTPHLLRPAHPKRVVLLAGSVPAAGRTTHGGEPAGDCPTGEAIRIELAPAVPQRPLSLCCGPRSHLGSPRPARRLKRKRV